MNYKNTSLRFYTLLFIFIGIFFSCKTPSFFTSGRKVEDIKKLTIIGPFAQIYSIEKGNQKRFEGIISDTLRTRIYDEINSIFKGREIEPIRINSLEEGKFIINQINDIYGYYELENGVSRYQISKKFETLLSNKKIDFALVISITGYERTDENLRKEKNRGKAMLAMSILTPVLFLYTPSKSEYIWNAMIIDRQNRNISFYKNFIDDKDEPLDSKKVHNLFSDFFEDYLNTKK
jgi:hypothetical protein